MTKAIMDYLSLKKRNDIRRFKFKLDKKNEEIFFDFNSKIKHIKNKKLNSSYKKLKPIFIIGNPRSGSSLLYELLISVSNLNFFNNFISKFWKNPIFGIFFWNTFQQEKWIPGYKSEIGKFNNRMNAPSEFQYFWNELFGSYSNGTSVIEVNTSQKKKIRQKLSEIINFFDNNVIFKSQYWLSYQCEILQELFPHAKFITIKRNKFYTAQSIFFARKKINKNINQWWSIRPKKFKEYLNKKWYQQIVYQIQDVEDSITRAKLKNNYTICYEDLCKNPIIEIRNLCKFLKIKPNLKKINSKSIILSSNKKLQKINFKNIIRELSKYEYLRN